MTKTPERPRDASQLAKLMIDIASGDVSDAEKPQPQKDPAAVALGRRGGLKGGKARAEKLSKDERTEIAKKASRARWQKD